MTDFASLVLAVDSTQVPKGAAALDSLAKSGDNATRSANQFAAAERAATLEAERAAAGLVKASSAAGQARIAAMGHAQSLNTVTASAGAQRAGMQQLSFQIGDVAQQFALGTNPMMIFAQQGGQVVQALSLMRGGATGLVGFLAGPWGAVIMGAATVVGMFGASLLQSGRDAQVAKGDWRDARSEAERLIGSLKTLAALRKNSLADDINRAQMRRNELTSRQMQLEGFIGRQAKDSRGNPMFSYAEQKELQGVKQELLEVNDVIRLGNEELARKAERDNAAAAASRGHASAARSAGGGIREQVTAVSDEQRAYDQALASVKSRTAELRDETALRTILNNQVKQGVITAAQADEQIKVEQQLRPLIAAGLKANSAELVTYREVMKAANDEEKRGQEIRSVQQIEKQIVLTGRLNEAEAAYNDQRLEALKGLSGEPLEQQLRAIQLEYEHAANNIRAEAEAAEALANGMGDLANKILDTNTQQNALLDQKARWEEQAAAVAMMREQVDALGGSLGNALQGMGGFGGGLGQLFGALTSANPKAALLGMGGIGTLAGTLLVPGAAGGLSKSVGKGLESLGVGGALSRTLGTGLVGAGIGGIAGSLTGSSTGGSIAGAAAAMVGLGPVGILIGGLIGGLLGGLFKKTKTGSASITESGVSLGGNNADLKEKVGGLGSNLQGAIGTIAQSLGATIGKYAVSVGIRKDEFRVSGSAGADVTGKNPAGLLYRGKDAEQAAAIALRNAIEDGAIAGISDTIKRLLLAGPDIDAQVAKAQQLQEALKQAAYNADPLGTALKELDKQMQGLRDIATEASATTEEFAAIEKLAADQRKAILDQAASYINENFVSDIEKLAKAAEHVDKTFAELNVTGVTTKDQFRALVEGIDLTTDAGTVLYGKLLAIAPEFLAVANAVDQATAAAQALAEAAAEAEAARVAEIARQKGDLDIQLAEALGDKTLALALQRERELAAIDVSLREQQKLIWAVQDHAAAVSSARDVLSQAYQRERGELEQTAAKMHSLADSLRSFRASMFGGSDDISRNGALARLMLVGGQAAAGNENAARDLPGVTNTFLDVSRNSASTLTQYRRDQALAASYVDKAIAGIEGQASAAEQQIKKLDESVQGLLDLNDNVTTVKEAIENLQALLGPPSVQLANDQAEANAAAREFQRRLIDEVQRLNADSSVLQTNMAERLARIERFMARGETDGFRVFNESDTPIYTSVV